MGIIDAGLSLLGRTPNRVNKGETDKTKQGVVGELEDALTLDTPNEDLATTAKKRQLRWEDSTVKSKMDEKGKENERYYLGEQFAPTNLDVARPMVDNALFEAMETQIPMATQKNPEPVITLANSEPQDDDNKLAYARKLTKKLAEVADEIKLRLNLKKAAHYNELYLLSVGKVGWDMDKNIPSFTMLRPEKLILDPEATIDPADGYTGKYIGEYRTMEADMLLDLLKKHGGEEGGVKLIQDLVDKKDGTDIRFIEWWENDQLYWTLGNEVLFKSKNINWNADQKAQPAQPAAPQLDPTTGQPMPNAAPAQPTPGINHLSAPSMPYIFLSVINLGKGPVSDTSNISQNLSNQDRLNKRNRQIDKAIDKMNGGTVVSLANAGLTQENAGPAVKAMQNGGTVVIPAGEPEKAVKHMSGNGLPADVYNDRTDIRQRISDIYGTRGSTAAGLMHDRTVRGKMMAQQADASRIGGGVSEYLEQFADDIFNWFVQMLYVHDDAFISNQPPPKIKVSVKEGSLLPKDAATMAAEAMNLAKEGMMSKLDLYKRLDYPNPEEMAANAWLEANAPEVLYGQDPRVAQVIQQRSQSAMAEKPKPMTITAAFKDLPPDAQSQALAQDGITAHPEAMAAHNAHKASMDHGFAKDMESHKAGLDMQKQQAMPPPAVPPAQ